MDIHNKSTILGYQSPVLRTEYSKKFVFQVGKIEFHSHNWKKKILSNLILVHLSLNILSQIYVSGCNGRMVSVSDSQPQDRGFESRQNSWLIKKRPAWATGGDNGRLGSLSRKWVSGYRQRCKLYLGYLWRLEACKWVYIPQGWAGDWCNRSARGNNM